MTTPIYDWRGGNGSFSNSLKWTLSTNNKVHATPDSDDIADFEKGGTISGDGSVDQIIIAASVTFTGAITASDPNGSVLVSSHLTLADGADLTAYDVIVGTATVTFDAGSTLNVGAGVNGSPYGDIGIMFGGGAGIIKGATINSSGLIGIANSVDGVSNSGIDTVTVSAKSHVVASYTGIGGAEGFSSTDSNRGTLILTGAGTTWDDTGSTGQGAQGSVVVGVTGKARLLVEDGAVLTDNIDGEIASDSTSTGSATVTGAGSQWDNDDGLYVGISGDGKLLLENDGTVTSDGGLTALDDGAIGLVTITSDATWTDSAWFDNGYDGKGTLTIEDGGSLYDGTFGDIGTFATGVGVALVEGKGSNWTTDDAMYVGDGGNGRLTLKTGGTVDSDGGLIGNKDDAVGVVVIEAGSTWTNSAWLDVGGGAKGSLTIEGGGKLSDGTFGDIGAVAGAVGTALVEGAGSNWTIDEALYLGDAGQGGLTLATGGTVDSASAVLGNSSGGVGTARIESGSTWTDSLWLDVGYAGKGTLTIQAGGTMDVGADLDLADGAAVLAGDDHTVTGLITVTGKSALFDVNGQIDLGLYGVGLMTVSAGAKATAGDATGQTSSGVVVGFYADGAGTLTVTGAGSDLAIDGLIEVGYGGKGRLVVSDGATVSADINPSLGDAGFYFAADNASSATVLVTGSGSSLTTEEGAYIGDYGKAMVTASELANISIALDLVLGNYAKSNGEVTVESDATFAVGDDVTLGAATGAHGEITVTGASSEFKYGPELLVGDQGFGTLLVEAGGSVTTTDAGAIDVATVKGGTGTVTVEGAGSDLKGASLNIGGETGKASVTLSSGGAATLTGAVEIKHDGTLTLAGGDLNAASVSLASTGTITGHGKVIASTITGATITATGGTLELDGSVDGVTKLNVGASSPLMLDQGLAKTSSATFSGADEELTFLNPQLILGTIKGFSTGDEIDLVDIKIDTTLFHRSDASATLTLTLSDGDTAKLTFAGSFLRGDFGDRPDGSNGTLIKFI